MMNHQMLIIVFEPGWEAACGREASLGAGGPTLCIMFMVMVMEENVLGDICDAVVML